MTFPRPRSLSSLLVLGLLILVVPLTLAVLQAGTQLGRLAQETDTLVRQGVDLSGETQSLFRYLAAYERSANLYLLLTDPVRACLGHDALLALALAPFEQLDDGRIAWRYDIDRYNPERPWNNPEDWANPQNFDKFRW